MNKRHNITSLLALATASVLVEAPGAAHADSITPPAVPAILSVPAGHKPFAEGHATGTQNYQCRASATGYTWAFTGPVATLQSSHSTTPATGCDASTVGSSQDMPYTADYIFYKNASID